MEDRVNSPEGLREREAVGVATEYLLYLERPKPAVIKVLHRPLCSDVSSIQPHLLTHLELFCFSMVCVIEPGHIGARLPQCCTWLFKYIVHPIGKFIGSFNTCLAARLYAHSGVGAVVIFKWRSASG